MNSKERLLSLLKGEDAGRPIFMVPGGLLMAPPCEIVEGLKGLTPAIHSDPDGLASIGLAIAEKTGADSVGLPFCMTVESEAYGGETEASIIGTRGKGGGLPPSYEYPLKSVDGYNALPELDPLVNGRLPVIIETLKRLSELSPDRALVGDAVGPLSLASSLLDMGALLKAAKKDAPSLHGLLDLLANNSARYISAMVDAGADIISITEPAFNAADCGPDFFSEFSLPYLNRLTDAAHKAAAGVMVHLCGDISKVADATNEIKADILSLDNSFISAPDDFAFKGVFGANISASLLEKAAIEEVEKASTLAIAKGFRLLAPSCGLSSKAKTANLRALAYQAGSDDLTRKRALAGAQ